METKTKYLIGGLAVAFIGVFIWKSKKDADAKSLADAKAQAIVESHKVYQR
jgi:hypothetical protein